MWRRRPLIGPRAETPNSNAARIGLALGWHHSSSAVYEAEIVRARREAGIYGPDRQQRQALVAIAFSVALTVIMVLAVQH